MRTSKIVPFGAVVEDKRKFVNYDTILQIMADFERNFEQA